MPANLTPQYFSAEAKYKEATTSRDKVKALRGMLSAIPKHKGTEKLQGDIKRRIALLTELEEQAKKKGGRGPSPDHVPHEGAGQVVIAGEPNAGKSALFDALTHAHPEVASYPFATKKPQPGMIHFEDIQIQLVDTPPFSDEYMETWLGNVPRSGNALLLVVDLSGDSPEDQILRLLAHLESAGLTLYPETEWNREVRDAVFEKRALLIGTKADLAASVPESVGAFPLHAVSVETGVGLDLLPVLLFRMLQVLRVYSKMPRHKPDMERPFTLPIGSTIGDLCRMVHKDFTSNLRFARLWREGSFQGIQIHQDHDIMDRDIVELHI